MDAALKAKELIEKFTFEIGRFNAKACAVICVKELIDLADRASDYQNMWRVPPNFELTTEVQKEVDYWNEVLTHLSNQ